ncbi:hypothetical protein [Pontixanthobacter sp.]|uniref:hypothetical protein n=1 Tax=Pontixanthobacter sp. TaxID=2792078 RepID=UPI003C7B5E35
MRYRINSQYGAEAALIPPPLNILAEPEVTSGFDRTIYGSKLIPGGEPRRDWNYGGQAKLDVTHLLSLPESFEMTVGVSPSWQDPNDPLEREKETKAFMSLDVILHQWK